MLKYHGLFRVLFSILFLGIPSNAYSQRTGGGSPNPIISLQAVLPSTFDVGAATSAQFTITNQIIPNVPASPGVASEVLNATLPAPAGILWTLGAAPSGCSIGAGDGVTQNLHCLFTAGLDAGASVTVAVSTTPTAIVCGSLAFAASASAPLASGVSFTGSSIAACPALAVTKTADAASVASGSQIGFTIGVTNGGGSTAGVATADGVSLSDSLPATGTAWSIDSDSTNGCSISSFSVGDAIVSSLACPIGDMAPGASATIHVVSTPSVCGQFSNTAIVTAANASSVSSPQASSTIFCAGLNVVTKPDAPVNDVGDTAGLTTTVSLPNTVGPAAANVTLNQPLPGGSGANWQIDPSSPGAADCTISGNPGQTLSCAFGSLALGTSESVHVTSATTLAGCQNFATQATASASNYSSVTSNANLVIECPALTLTKVADAPSVNAGSTIGFTLILSNALQSGVGRAHNLTMTDTLPTGAGINWAINPPIGSFCSLTGAPQVLSCSLPTLDAGQSLTVHLQSNTGPSACGSYLNDATVSASNAPSQDATASTMVLCPSLQVSKTADNNTVSAGDPIGYSINVINSAAAGTGAATGLTLSDTLPANSGLGWTVDSGPSGCSINAGVLSCSIDTLAVGASATVHVTSGTDQTTCGTVSNSAVIAAANSVLVAPSSTAAISVNCPTLSLANLADAGSVSAGGPIGYTLTATNSGPGTAKNVALAETLPGAGGLDWSIAPAYTMPGTCTITGPIGAQVLACSFGNMATGASALVHITSATGGGTCGAESPTAGLSADNAVTLTQSATTTVLCPQLQLTKVASSSTASANDAIGFTLSLTNGGAGPATGVILTDTLPASPGLGWSITGPNPNGCTITGGILTCNVGNLISGGSAAVSIASPTTPATCGAVNNTAAVTTTNSASLQSSAAVIVGCPNLMITKTPASNPVNAGQNAVFNLVVNNLGSGVARATTLKDTLPTGVTWSDDNNACKISTGVMSCSFGDLAPGQVQTVHVTAATSAGFCTSLSNTATVAATNENSGDLANNTSTATININCQADLGIVQLPLLLRVSKGSLQAYGIGVFNAGPRAAQGVVISDPIPAGTAFASLIADGTCTKPSVGAAGTVSCQIATLPVGGTWLGLLTVKVTVAGHSTITNKATVTATTVDPKPGNNTTSVSTPGF